MTNARRCPNNILISFSEPFLILILPHICASASLASDDSTQLYKKVLSLNVKDGLVDYSRLKSDPGELNDYIEQTTLVTKEEFNIEYKYYD